MGDDCADSTRSRDRAEIDRHETDFAASARWHTRWLRGWACCQKAPGAPALNKPASECGSTAANLRGETALRGASEE